MRRFIVLPLVAALGLAACNSAKEEAADSATASSATDVAAAAAQMPRPLPGKYTSSAKLISLDVPGMPAEQAAQMKSMFASTAKVTDFCLTPADVEKGYEQMTRKQMQGECQFDHYDVDGGKLDAKLSCNMAEGVRSEMAMKGEVRPDGSVMTMDINQAMPMGSMHMVMEVTSQRTGDCPAG